MNITASQIKPLLRVLYLLVFAVFLNIGLNLFYYLNPPTSVIPSIQNKASWKLKSVITDIPKGKLGKKVNYGYRIIKETYSIIGPQAKDKSKRLTGNNLTCNNCHLNAGRKIGSGSFVGVMSRYPQFRGRENRTGNMKDRINGCMERSMNGQPFPEESEEMDAILAYLEWLSEDVPQDIAKLYKGYADIDIPDYKADTSKGKLIYVKNCLRCHQQNGTGMKNNGDSFSGYLYPPIAGDDTYNDGAGMNRVLTSARFIKGNMPFGATYDAPTLTDEEAYHVAAYINSFSRPKKSNRDKDFPLLKLKPVSTPYGPWADSFTEEQHTYGPFPPIISFYKEKYNLEKTK